MNKEIPESKQVNALVSDISQEPGHHQHSSTSIRGMQPPFP